MMATSDTHTIGFKLLTVALMLHRYSCTFLKSTPINIPGKLLRGSQKTAGTPQDQGNVLKFLAVGDWGIGGASKSAWSSVNSLGLNVTHNENDDGGALGVKADKALYQMDVAAAMGNYASTTSPQPQFMVALGDNFYKKGVTSTTDYLWEYLWWNVYFEPSSNQYPGMTIPWYPVLGNHDWAGHTPDVQVQMTRENPKGYWQMPARNYTQRFSIPGGGTVQIIFTDTTTLAPSANECCNEKGGVSEVEQALLIADQRSHLIRMLDEAVENPPTWLIMAGHYPIFSTGKHGDSSDLLSNLQDLLEKYNVHAYVCGHDHLQAHLMYGETHHFIAGGGAMQDELGNGGTQAKMMWSGAGFNSFAVFEATVTTLTVTYIDTDGRQKYSYAINNPFTSKPTISPTESPTINPTQIPSQKTSNSGAFATQDFTLRFAAGAAGLVVVIAAALYAHARKDKLAKMAKQTGDWKYLETEDEEDEKKPQATSESTLSPALTVRTKHRRGLTNGTLSTTVTHTDDGDDSKQRGGRHLHQDEDYEEEVDVENVGDGLALLRESQAISIGTRRGGQSNGNHGGNNGCVRSHIGGWEKLLPQIDPRTDSSDGLSGIMAVGEGPQVGRMFELHGHNRGRGVASSHRRIRSDSYLIHSASRR